MSENRIGHFHRKRNQHSGNPAGKHKDTLPTMQRTSEAQDRPLFIRAHNEGRRVLELPQLRMERRGIF
jgi:hypothetical protein